MAARSGSAASEASVRRGLRRVVLAAAIGAAFAAQTFAQDGGLVARYPEPAKVAADYADDAERYMAFKILYDDLGAKTAGARVPGAYARISAYFGEFQAVTAKYMNLRKDSPENVAYTERLDRLFTDEAFRRAVIEKYRLADVKAPPAAARVDASPASGDVTDEMIQSAFLRAAPFALAGLAAMALVSRALLRNSLAHPSGRSAPLPPPPGVPAMPESLRVVVLPGVEYAVETSCGVVIEKETTVATTVHTTTTSGQAYAVGNEIHFTPGQTQTTASSVQKDVIWVRTPEGREEPWQFSGGTFKARRGQVVSVITRPLRDGSSDRLFAYNHATSQLERCEGVDRAHAVRHAPAWWTSFAIASVGFGIGVWIVIGIGPDPIRGPFGAVAAWVVGAVPAAVAAFVVEGFASRFVVRRRSARFEDHYVPGFRRYLEEITPALEARLAGK
jgi:hypothetical protein